MDGSLPIADRETKPLTRSGLSRVAPVHTSPDRKNGACVQECASLIQRASGRVPALAATLRSIALELDPPADQLAEITVAVAAQRVRLAAVSGDLLAATRGAR